MEIRTGIHSGYTQVTVAAHRSTPDADPGPWQEIVEVSVHTPTGELLVGALMDDLEEELPSPAASGPGDYRLRCRTNEKSSVPVALTWALNSSLHGRK